MRLSTRLLSNASTTYLRLGATFLLGLFSTWYILGEAGIAGFGLIALATSSTGPSHAIERALRFGLVRELAVAVASGEPFLIRRSLSSAFRLCLQASVPLTAFVLLLAALARAGLFNTSNDQVDLDVALAILILGEGAHAVARLLSAPYLQSIFAAQRVGLDNLLMVVARSTYALSAVAVFGWLLPDADLEVQLGAFALSRATLQLADVPLGIWLAKRLVKDLRLDFLAFDHAEYRSIRNTVWHSAQVSLLLNINPQLMAILINLFFGLTYNTIWQVVVQLSGFAWMFAEGLLRGIGPLTAHLESRGRMRAAVELMTRSIRYQFTFVLYPTLLLGFHAGPLLALWVGGRLRDDPHLAASGVNVTEALELGASLAVISLAAQALRAGFFGVERSLYGMGKVHSYAWSCKWATLVSVGVATALMALSRQPVSAPISILMSNALFSGAVLLAARREAGLSIVSALRRSVPRPLITSLVFFAFLAPTRLLFDRLTLVSLSGLLLGSSLLYGLLVLLLALEPDERDRIVHVSRQGLRWARRRLDPRRKDPPDLS